MYLKRTPGFISIPPFAQKFFGYSEGEILNRNIVSTIVPPTDTAGYDLATMIADIVKNPERFSNNENENMKSNGDRVWIAWTNKGILDEHGNIREILCVGNDITERKQPELAGLFFRLSLIGNDFRLFSQFCR